ncbi:hypothetical protein MTDSW087_00767 [Methylobacterium dankookense]|uniref:YjiS-like domain-containing protein n=1 Tax=Methylobacterium dankookense TaxID=560405 RepID=A0A564FTA6_9HYPH|nr:hypothetical protein IFDJLNFL_0755 [Methylobacterium dankookense]VUF11094.1 hypothetical protein MTDSW087_00767 [Methylobacterium dankookense]
MWLMLRYMRAWRLTRSACRELRRLSDRELEDIGLNPCEVISRRIRS